MVATLLLMAKKALITSMVNPVFEWRGRPSDGEVGELAPLVGIGQDKRQGIAG